MTALEVAPKSCTVDEETFSLWKSAVLHERRWLPAIPTRGCAARATGWARARSNELLSPGPPLLRGVLRRVAVPSPALCRRTWPGTVRRRVSHPWWVSACRPSCSRATGTPPSRLCGPAACALSRTVVGVAVLARSARPRPFPSESLYLRGVGSLALPPRRLGCRAACASSPFPLAVAVVARRAHPRPFPSASLWLRGVRSIALPPRRLGDRAACAPSALPPGLAVLARRALPRTPSSAFGLSRGVRVLALSPRRLGEREARARRPPPTAVGVGAAALSHTPPEPPGQVWCKICHIFVELNNLDEHYTGKAHARSKSFAEFEEHRRANGAAAASVPR